MPSRCAAVAPLAVLITACVAVTARELPADVIRPAGTTAPRVAESSNTLLSGPAAALHRTVKIYGASIGSQHGYGSGIIVSADGKVVTVLNLVLEARSLRAVTSDGHIYPVEVLYRDEYRQLALLQMARHTSNRDTDAPLAEQMAPARPEPFALNDSTHLRTGDWVYVVGNPFKVAEGEEALTVMKGVLSGRSRLSAMRGTQPFPYLGDILLLDAITSGPGQGGSAVVDLDGRLVGIVGESVTSRQTNTLLNYALPVEEVVAFLKDAEAAMAGGAAGAATRPAGRASGPGYHGIVLSKIAYHRQLPFVRSVARGSPAAEAGVRADDLIVSANGTAIPRARDFTELCERLAPGEELSLIVKRGEQLIPIRFTLTEPPQ